MWIKKGGIERFFFFIHSHTCMDLCCQFEFNDQSHTPTTLSLTNHKMQNLFFKHSIAHKLTNNTHMNHNILSTNTTHTTYDPMHLKVNSIDYMHSKSALKFIKTTINIQHMSIHSCHVHGVMTFCIITLGDITN